MGIGCSLCQAMPTDLSDSLTQKVALDHSGGLLPKVFQKLKKGVNQDVSMPASGTWEKVQHEPGHMEAINHAGFESVRIFMPFYESIESTEQRIIDAFDYNLTVVICLWGLEAWSSSSIEAVRNQLAARWRELAKAWRHFPAELIFEVLNEPGMLGFDASDHKEVMSLYNDAVYAIRQVDMERPILIAPPGLNEARLLDPWVSEEYMNYKVNDTLSFKTDKKIGIAIHFYKPNHADGNNFSMWTASLLNGWQESIDVEIDHVLKWTEKIGFGKPVIVTEWGCWLFNQRSNDELTQWIDYHLVNFERHNIGNMWYAGIHSNQRQFGIFDSEFGWNQVVLDQLTNTYPAKIPGTSQLIDSEFFPNSKAWTLSSNEATKYLVGHEEALSGNSSLRIDVPWPMDCKLFQQTLSENATIEPQAPGRTLIHLIEGNTYEISFMAKSIGGLGKIKILLVCVDTGSILYDSNIAYGKWIEISTEASVYTVHYKHQSTTATDVRFAIDVGSQAQSLILDRISLQHL